MINFIFNWINILILDEYENMIIKESMNLLIKLHTLQVILSIQRIS